MQRMIGNNVRNMGAGGRTAADKAATEGNGTSKSWYNWVTKGYATDKWTNTSADKADSYIMYLGTNDISIYGSFSGDISTDITIDTSAKTITVNDNTTSVGGYCEILNAVFGVQDKARVFCLTLPNYRNDDTTRTEMNNKIKEIINAYKSIGKYIYLVDIETYGISKDNISTWKSIYYTGGHLNVFGYKWLCNFLISYINYIIENNKKDFVNIEIVDDDNKLDY